MFTRMCSVAPVIDGSLTKDCPERAEGGKVPVHAYFKHSIIVVLPNLCQRNECTYVQGIIYKKTKRYHKNNQDQSH